MSPTLDTYKRLLSIKGGSSGQEKIENSNMIIVATWDDDPSSKVCYIYDFFHDGEPEKNVGLTPWQDTLKTKIKAKYLKRQSNTLAKDQVDYYLMFQPDQKCPLDYYEDLFSNRYGAEFPIGLYVDIPDRNNIYRRWMICGGDYENQFAKYMILPCDYRFMWISNNQKNKVWGTLRSQNSYNSGVWRDYVFQSPENQKKFWVPQNQITDTIYYDQRFIISTYIEKPITWIVTKVENDSPFGISKFTVAQDKFNPSTDYINFTEKEFFADYYKKGVNPKEENQNCNEINAIFKIQGSQQVLKSGGSSKMITVSFYDGEKKLESITPNWSFYISDKNVYDLINVEYQEDKCSIVISVNNEDLIGEKIDVVVSINESEKRFSYPIDIIGL